MALHPPESGVELCLIAHSLALFPLAFRRRQLLPQAYFCTQEPPCFSRAPSQFSWLPPRLFPSPATPVLSLSAPTNPSLPRDMLRMKRGTGSAKRNGVCVFRRRSIPFLPSPDCTGASFPYFARLQLPRLQAAFKMFFWSISVFCIVSTSNVMRESRPIRPPHKSPPINSHCEIGGRQVTLEIARFMLLLSNARRFCPFGRSAWVFV